MPGRQAIIYDKRTEAVSKGKWGWFSIWAKALNGSDAPPLDHRIREKSQVWRVELRAGKRHLKDDWFIDGWASFYGQLPKLFAALVEDIRYCTSTDDTNRSRWPLHPIWNAVREVLEDGLFDHRPTLSPEEYVEVLASTKSRELERQAFGLIISSGAIKGVPGYALPGYAHDIVDKLMREVQHTDRPIAQRLKDAALRYRYLV